MSQAFISLILVALSDFEDRKLYKAGFRYGAAPRGNYEKMLFTQNMHPYDFIKVLRINAAIGVLFGDN